MLPVKIFGLGILSPIREAALNHAASMEISDHVVSETLGGVEFDTMVHNKTIICVYNSYRASKTVAYEETFKSVTSDYLEDLIYRMER